MDNDFDNYQGTAEQLRREIAEHKRSNEETGPDALSKAQQSEEDQRAAFAMRSDVRAVDADTRAALIRQIQGALKTL